MIARLRAVLCLSLAGLGTLQAQTDAVAPRAEPVAPAAATTNAPAAAPEEKVARATPGPGASRFTLPERPPGVPSLDYVGHRFHEPSDSGGWGWIRLPQDGWNRARWVALQETPGVAVAPWRNMGGSAGDDQDYEFTLHGYIAPYPVYDPHTNEMLDVFVLESYEVIGQAKPLHLLPGPPQRSGRSRSSYSARDRGFTDF